MSGSIIYIPLCVFISWFCLYWFGDWSSSIRLLSLYVNHLFVVLKRLFFFLS